MANQALRQEINLFVFNHASGALNTAGTLRGDSTTLGCHGLVQLDTAAFSGSPTYWFEAVINCPAGNTGTVGIFDIAGAVDKTTVTDATALNVIKRSQFTPTAGARTYCWRIVGDGVNAFGLLAARIIILQNEATITKTDTQIEIGGITSVAMTNTAVADIQTPKFWKYVAANYSATATFSVEVCFRTSAANNVTVTLCRTSDNASNVTVVSAASSSAAYTRTRVNFTPVDGETYKLRSFGSTTKSQFWVGIGKIIIHQTSATKVETQFLLLDGPSNGAATGQSQFTQWNASEWNAGGGTITYKHLMDSDNASNSLKLTDITASSDITNSTCTGVGQVTSTGTLGAFVDGHFLDNTGIASPGTIYAGRIQVLYAWAASGTLFTQSLTASLSPTAAFGPTNTLKKITAALSFVSAQARSISNLQTATLSFVSAQTRAVRKGLTATLSFVGAFARGLFKLQMFTATLSFVGALTTAAVHHYTQALAATLSFVSAQSRNVSKGLSATLSFIGAITRRISKGLVASLSFVGAITKMLARALSATLSFVGNLVTAGVHHYTQALAATLSFSGSVTKSTLKSITAVLSFVGALARSIRHALAATLNFVGTLVVSSSHFHVQVFTATLSATGALARSIAKNMSATLSFVSAIGKAIKHGLSATLSFIANLATQLIGGAHNYTETFVATLAPTAALVKTVVKGAFIATLVSTAAFKRSLVKVFSATLAFSGGIGKAIAKQIAATLSFTAGVIYSGKLLQVIAGWITGSKPKADSAGSSASVVKTSAQLKGDKTQ